MVDNHKEAKILWLVWDYDNYQDWGINEETTYVNFFKKEAALVCKSHIANLVNTTLADKSCI
jgi:hypothetical protein